MPTVKAQKRPDLRPAGGGGHTFTESMRSRDACGLAMILALAHAGCGMDGGANPSAVETRVSSRSVAPQEAAAAATVVVGSRGATIEVAVNWTIGRNNVDVYVTPEDCFDIPSALTVFSCLVVAQAASETARPERLTFSGAAGASYKVFVFNRGAEPDTVTVTLTIR